MFFWGFSRSGCGSWSAQLPARDSLNSMFLLRCVSAKLRPERSVSVGLVVLSEGQLEL